MITGDWGRSTWISEGLPSAVRLERRWLWRRWRLALNGRVLGLRKINYDHADSAMTYFSGIATMRIVMHTRLFTGVCQQPLSWTSPTGCYEHDLHRGQCRRQKYSSHSYYSRIHWTSWTTLRCSFLHYHRSIQGNKRKEQKLCRSFNDDTLWSVHRNLWCRGDTKCKA